MVKMVKLIYNLSQIYEQPLRNFKGVAFFVAVN